MIELQQKDLAYTKIIQEWASEARKNGLNASDIEYAAITIAKNYTLIAAALDSFSRGRYLDARRALELTGISKWDGAIEKETAEVAK